LQESCNLHFPDALANRLLSLFEVSGLVFILGAPRSGTTWMWGLLTSHPTVVPLMREDFDPGNPSVVDGRRMTSETGAFVRYDDALILEAVERKRRDFPGKTLVEKTPLHTLHISRILNLFPEAKLVYMMRDPRAVVSSVIHATFFNFDRSVENTAKQYRKFLQQAEPYFDTPRCLLIRYEDLAADPAASVQKVLGFLELSEEPAARMIEENRGRVKVDIDGVFRRGTVDGYRNDLRAEQIEVIEKELSDLLEKYYPAGTTVG